MEDVLFLYNTTLKKKRFSLSRLALCVLFSFELFLLLLRCVFLCFYKSCPIICTVFRLCVEAVKRVS